MSGRRYMDGALPEKYINTVSATGVVLTKAVEAAAAVFGLAALTRTMVPLLIGILKGTMDLDRSLNLLFSQFGGGSGFFGPEFSILAGSTVIPILIYSGIYFVLSFGMLLTLVDFGALFSLRFFKKGAGVSKIIHYIYMIIGVLHLVLFSVTSFLIFRSIHDLAGTGADSRDAAMGLQIAWIVVCIVYVIIFILIFCYHKDIAMAMDTAAYEIRTGRKDEMDFTHLSGISFFFALPYMIFLFSLIVGLLFGNLPVNGRNGLTPGQIIPPAAVCFILILKQLFICFCYRNQKKAHAAAGK